MGFLGGWDLWESERGKTEGSRDKIEKSVPLYGLADAVYMPNRMQIVWCTHVDGRDRSEPVRRYINIRVNRIWMGSLHVNAGTSWLISRLCERVRYRREKEEKRKNERNCELCGNLSGLIGWICRRMCVVCVSLDRFMKPSDLYLDQEFNFLSENVFMESWV